MKRPISERYCVDSGRPVHMIPGDRCLIHGSELYPCFTAIRDARCKHPRPSTNHRTPDVLGVRTRNRGAPVVTIR